MRPRSSCVRFTSPSESRGRKRKETPRELEVSKINAAFKAAIEAGRQGFKPGKHCGYSGFQDRKADSISACSERNLRQNEKSVAAPIAAPNGHNQATNDNACHLNGDLGRVVETWPELSSEARLMIMALVSAAESSSAQTPK